jgi:putative ABC transport system permease protein
MLIRIAWRNIWRDKRRSLIVLTSIVIGMIAIIFLDAFATGSLNQMLDDQLNTYISHLQVHKTGYRSNRIIQNYIPNYKKIENVLKQNTDIRNYTRRIVSFGLLSSASNSVGINIIGADPEMEKKITNIHNLITAGNYLSGKKHEIVISKKMAEKLDAGLGDKIVIMATALDGKVSSDVFRICGLFVSSGSEFDKFFVFINLQNAAELSGLNDKISEFAITVNNMNNLERVKLDLIKSLGDNYEVVSYKDIIPMMITLMETTKSNMQVVYVIIAIALIFGIINTKLMSVFERIREFGILMANGMKNIQVFQMIMAEAFFMALVGIAGGIIFGLALCLPLAKSGINFGAFSESLAGIGFASIIYPEVSFYSILSSSLVIMCTTLLGALYPAIKAVRLVPVKAIRYI